MPDSTKTKNRRPEKKKSKSKGLNPRTSLVLKIMAVILGVAIILVAGGFTFAATQEQHDSFCISCHTQPESTFYQREMDAQAVDLASAHKAKDTRCIDCHSGEGVSGRIQAELLGAHNALAFYTQTAVQPAVVTSPISDDRCYKCHQNIADKQDMNNHFHVFLPRWQSQDPNAATCVSCHQGHHTDGQIELNYLNRDTAIAVCDSCHRTLDGGE